MQKINLLVRRSLLALCLVFVLVLSTRSLPGNEMHKSAHAEMPIQHIIFIVEENHTFDSYFGAFPGANGATTGQVLINGQPQTIPLNPGQNVPAPFCHTCSCATRDDN